MNGRAPTTCSKWYVARNVPTARINTAAASPVGDASQFVTPDRVVELIVFHILHLTTGTVHPDFVAGAVYRNVTIGLGATPVGLFYIVAMVALGLHLLHGLWSLFQTLGLEHPHLNGFRRGVAVVLGVGLALAFVSIPVAVLAGLVR